MKQSARLVAICAIFLGATIPLMALKVVATFPITYDWTEQIAGESLELSLLVAPGQDVHTFEATPKQLAQLAEADAVVQLGLGMEYWLEDLLRASGFHGKRIVLAHSLNDGLRHLDEVACSGDHGHHDDHEHFHTDPHVWMDPKLVQTMCVYLAGELQALYPEATVLYARNRGDYSKQLEELDAYISNTFAPIPNDQRRIITHHNNLAYLADRYDLEVVATIKGSYSTEGDEPSARHIARIIDEIQDAQINAIFAESTSSPKLARQLSRETGLPEPPVLYIETFASRPEDGPQDYLSMMRSTVDSIATTLQAGRIE
ncbi:MAG: metal ABC transporter substrate-binding protein [Verrucomicrobiota bacterium]